jgi:hypothetical protein
MNPCDSIYYRSFLVSRERASSPSTSHSSVAAWLMERDLAGGLVILECCGILIVIKYFIGEKHAGRTSKERS